MAPGLLTAGLLAIAASVAAQAQAQGRPGSEPSPDPVFDHTITLEASIGYGSTDTRVRLDASDGTPGTVLDAEGDLGLDSGEMTGWAGVILRPRPRHRVRAGLNYLASDRRARQALEEDIRVGDEIYVAGEEVESHLRLRTWSVAYAYSFLRMPRAEAAFSLGVTSIGAYAKAGVPARAVSETEERSVPAPQVGVEVAARVWRDWYAEARYQYVKVNASGSSGRLSQLDAGVVFQFDRNISVGLGYSSFDVDVESNDPGDSGTFRYKTQGPRLFLRAGF